MKELLDQLDDAIKAASFPGGTQEQISYAAGLADAYEIVQDYMKNSFQIGAKYYVICIDNNTNLNEVYEMKLEHIRVNYRGTKFYTFKYDGPSRILEWNTDGIKWNQDYQGSAPDQVTLSSKQSLYERVYTDKDEALCRKDTITIKEK